MTIVDFTVASYQVRTARSYPPGSLGQYRENAATRDTFSLDDNEGEYFFVGITPNGAVWPNLVIEQRFASHQHIFNPGVLIVPETNVLFVGAGTRLLAYSLAPTVHRLWEDETALGFFGWQVFDNVVIMAAELEMAAWSISGKKLWSTFVEPPWSFQVVSGEVELEIMGVYSRFNIQVGPSHAR